MNIFILGSGGREHALAWKIAQSPFLSSLYIAPGNPGTSQLGTNLPIRLSDHAAIAGICRDYQIQLLVIGPEQPLADGLSDYLREQAGLGDLRIIGPGKAGAQLESSKDFAKAFMQRHHIPTARSATYTLATLEAGLAHIRQMPPPFVLKADGLAAGKGVIISHDRQEAALELKEMLEGKKFGKASEKVVIEEFLQGTELSVFVLTDGRSWCLLPEAKDYKRIGEGDTGPNTGGMGSVSPVAFADAPFMQKVEERIIRPTISGLSSEGIPYAGFIFFGLMSVNGEPFVIEYNVRMGDPETQSVLPRLASDLVPLLMAAADGRLERCRPQILNKVATTVIVASGGYPGEYASGKRIDLPLQGTRSLVFHAGTSLDEAGTLRTAGGRVLAITALAETLPEALQQAYADCAALGFEGKYFRRDIGRDIAGTSPTIS